MRAVNFLKKLNRKTVYLLLLIAIFGLLFTIFPRKQGAKSGLKLDLEMMRELSLDPSYFSCHVEDCLSDITATSISPAPLPPTEQLVIDLQDLLKKDIFIRQIIKLTDLEKETISEENIDQRVISEVRESIEIVQIAEDEIEIRAVWTEETGAVQLANSTLNTSLDWKINNLKQELPATKRNMDRLLIIHEREHRQLNSNYKKYLAEHSTLDFEEWPEIEQQEYILLEKNMREAEKQLKVITKLLEEFQQDQDKFRSRLPGVLSGTYAESR